MTIHTGDHADRLTAPQRLVLAAILFALPALCCMLLYAALHAHGHAPTAPPPAPGPVVVVSA